MDDLNIIRKEIQELKSLVLVQAEEIEKLKEAIGLDSPQSTTIFRFSTTSSESKKIAI